jgi:ankyrin repeat protein
VREFGADVNAWEHNHYTPLHCLIESNVGPRYLKLALAALLALGATLEGRDGSGRTGLGHAARANPTLVPILLARGASADVTDDDGASPLMLACGGRHPRVNVPLLLRATSHETRRAVDDKGRSALDFLVLRRGDWSRDAIEQLLLSGAPVLPEHAPLALPHAARLAAKLAPQAAARARRLPDWQAHEALVQLALDHQEMREIDAGVRRREARVRELEQALRGGGQEEEEEGRGGGDESGGGGGDDDER